MFMENEAKKPRKVRGVATFQANGDMEFRAHQQGEQARRSQS